MLSIDSLNSLQVAVPCIAGFLIAAISFPFYIGWLKKKDIGQFIRQEGPASHSAKARTPTMGGVCFMAAFFASTVLWLSLHAERRAEMVMVIGFALAAGLIGLADDTAKLRRQANAGISARTRLLCETGLGLALGALLLWHGNGTQVLLGGAHHQQLVVQLPVVSSLALAAFYMAATTNALNLHDGMDGLAGGTALLVFVSLFVMLLVTGQMQLAVVAGAGAGAVAGFLLYNRYKAQIFMGDTGSLFLGGLMAAVVLAGKLEFWFIPLSLIYVVETLSVIIQVIYFKMTKPWPPDKPVSPLSAIWTRLTKRLPGEGKRFFRMAPLHHHFEAIAAEAGIREWQVVASFWLAQAVLCLAVLALFLLA